MLIKRRIKVDEFFCWNRVHDDHSGTISYKAATYSCVYPYIPKESMYKFDSHSKDILEKENWYKYTWVIVITSLRGFKVSLIMWLTEHFTIFPELQVGRL